MSKPKAVARFEGVDESNLVSVKLAHPLARRDKQRLGIPEDADANVGDTVKVRSGDAQTLINAGYAQVDPEDSGAVRTALSGGEPKSEPASTSGNKSTSTSDKS